MRFFPFWLTQKLKKIIAELVNFQLGLLIVFKDL